nr:MAG TPA: hypothetical protein [Siphoviridae sp. ctQHO9]
MLDNILIIEYNAIRSKIVKWSQQEHMGGNKHEKK